MKKARAKTRPMVLEAGNLVTLHPDGPAGGFPMVVPVDHVENGTHWFLGSIAPLRRGHSVTVECPVPGDARYATRAEIVACSPSAFGLAIEPRWERDQERAFVRVSAHGLQVRVVQSALSGSEEDGEELIADVFDLLDVSAGGIRFASDARFSLGEYENEEVVCHFELPGALCFVVPGRIVRGLEQQATVGEKPSTAVEFTRLDELNRSQLLRWVYREQVRRHREDASV